MRFSLFHLCLLACAPAFILQGQDFFPANGSENSAGIGVALGLNGESIYVMKVLPNSPAAASKQIREGYRILAVGQGEEPAVSLTNKTVEDCVTMVRGPAGSQVRLTVMPEGGPARLTREVMLTRDELVDPLGLALDATLLEPGTPAPALRYVLLSDGKPASLSESHRGQIVVVKFWATWCAPSHEALTEMQKTAAMYADKKDKVAFLAICIDRATDTAKAPALMEKISTLVKEKKWSGTINGWCSLEARSEWFIGALPMTYIIGKDGKILLSDPTEPLEKVLEPLVKG